MNYALRRQALSGEIRKPLRITLSLTTRQADLASLDPLCQALLGPVMFEAARQQRASLAEQNLTVLSDQHDLSITFPAHESSKVVTTSVMMAAAAAGLVFLPLNTRLVWFVVAGAILALVRTLKNLRAAKKVSIRSGLAEVMAESDSLALWLSGGEGRKVSLEVWDRIRVETEARKPEEISSMFQAAIETQWAERFIPEAQALMPPTIQ